MGGLNTCGSLECRVGDGGVVLGHGAGVRFWSATDGRRWDGIRDQPWFSLNREKKK